MVEDLCHKLGIDATAENKRMLHELNKEKTGYKTISGQSQEIVSMFLFEVGVWWAVEKGIFVRTSRHQPPDIQFLPFNKEVKLDDGRIKTVWELL